MFRKLFGKVFRCTYTFMLGAFAGAPIYVTINDHFFTIARVEGCSMQPTLNPRDDDEHRKDDEHHKDRRSKMFNMLKMPKGLNETTPDYVLLNRWLINSNDVKTGEIVAVTSPRNYNTNLIKRVIGVEGDVIRTPRYKYNHVRVPRGHCWVEGDNGRESMDSNTFGPVSANMINAVATHIVWPPSRWQRLEFSVPIEREPVNYRCVRGKTKSARKCRTKHEDGMLVEIDCVNDGVGEMEEVME